MKKYLNLIIPSVVAVSFFIVNLMLWNNFFSSKEKIGREKKILEKQIALAEQIEEVDEKFASEVRPFFDDFFALKDFINRIAQDNAVVIYSLKPSSRSGEKDKFPEIDINLSLKGEYYHFLEFINVLEDNPAVGVKVMEIKEDNDQENLVSVSLIVAGTGR